MKCPKCGKEGCKYVDEKKLKEVEDKNKVKRKMYARDSNKVICNKCGYEGNA